MASINARLDQIIPKIKEQKFIDGRGLGNEISFYIFDYNPEDELLVRDYIKHIKKEFSIAGSTRSITEEHTRVILFSHIDLKDMR